MAESSIIARVLVSPLDVEATAWNALLATQSHPTPFMRHEYLAALHESGSATPRTGWTPRFMTLWQGDALVIGIGNGRQAGGGQVLCPEALVDDGMLDISILPAPTEIVGTLKSLMTEGWGLDNLFVRARLPWVEIKAAEGLAINLDGEPLAGDAMRFAVRKGALKVHLPQGSPLLGPSALRVS